MTLKIVDITQNRRIESVGQWLRHVFQNRDDCIVFLVDGDPKLRLEWCGMMRVSSAGAEDSIDTYMFQVRLKDGNWSNLFHQWDDLSTKKYIMQHVIEPAMREGHNVRVSIEHKEPE